MAKIPSPKPYGIAHDAWSREGSKMKNSDKFNENYDDVFKNRIKISGHVTILYRNGQKYELPNPSTHGKEAQKMWDEFNEKTGGIIKRKPKAIHE